MRVAAAIVLVFFFVVPSRAQTPKAKTQPKTSQTATGAKATATTSEPAGLSPLTNADVVALLTAKISTDLIVTQIYRANAVAFDLSTAGLVSLTKQSVPDAVLKAMMARQDSKGPIVHQASQPPPPAESPEPDSESRWSRVKGRLKSAVTREPDEEEEEASQSSPAPETANDSHRATSARACKPDVSGQDPITKKHVERWQQVLSSTGIMSEALLARDVTFTAYVTRGGDKNYIMISISKVEENLARAVFESQYHATKGDQLVFGFKNGEPLSFVATEVSNQAKAGTFSGKLNMNVVWAAEVPDNDMAMARATLTTKQVDAIRISQASTQVDKSVPDKNGRRMMEKFVCFYQYLDQTGIDLSAVAVSRGQSAALSDNRGTPPREGKYVRKDKSSDFIELGHGMFSMLQDGQSLDGTYRVDGDTLILNSPRMRVQTQGRFVGDTIKDNEGIVWEKQTEPHKPTAQPTSSAEERLRKLDDLLKKGLVSKAEYDKKRAAIIDEM